MLDSFLGLDVRTLILVLFFGNLVFVVLLLAFHHSTDARRDWAAVRPLFLAKIFLGTGFFLLSQRNLMPPLASVNLGNTVAFVGFYYEAVSMLRILNETRFARSYLLPVSAAAIAGFNIVEFIRPDASLRIATASIGIILILSMPCVRLFVSPNTGKFKRWVGVMHLCVLVMLIPRTVHGLTTEMYLFTNTYVQTLTFLAMVLQLVFSLPAYLLLIKEDADKIIAGMAATDMLTGLANRYAFIDAAERVFLRSRIKGGTMAMLFIDIDFFKAINDRYGHGFGDKVLASLGRTINESLRPTDLSCRYGGEEFVILLHDAGGDSASIVAERIREQVSALSFPENPGFCFTLSVGVFAGIPTDDDSLDLFIDRADSALYAAKRAGRDRIVEYDHFVSRRSATKVMQPRD